MLSAFTTPPPRTRSQRSSRLLSQADEPAGKVHGGMKGHVVVSHGKEQLRRPGPGDWFGELGLLRADTRRTATVTTDGPVETRHRGPPHLPHGAGRHSRLPDRRRGPRPRPLPLRRKAVGRRAQVTPSGLPGRCRRRGRSGVS
ncbi:MAG: cyclic nucleotide-binding domain-containing protein [Actinobacteria bacterium]|nr:cyclic nucleotide-binding domain-containing protein [Actinomycetota bacterium]